MFYDEKGSVKKFKGVKFIDIKGVFLKKYFTEKGLALLEG